MGSAEGVKTGSDASQAGSAMGIRTASHRPLVAAGGVLILGAALGVSQAIHGAYNEKTWAPIALGALGVVLALAVGVPRRLPVALVAPVLGLWLWSLLSTGWGDSRDLAHTSANRWLLYAAVLAVLCWLIANNRSRATLLLTGAAAGIVGVALWMVVRMLSGHGPALFLGPRLDNPLGYINGEAGYLLVGMWPCLALAERSGRKQAALAGLGLSGVVLVTALGLLSQSRSWGIAVVATVVLVLAAIPGRRRRGAAILLTAGAVALIYSPLSHVWRDTSATTGAPTTTTTHHAGVVILIAAVVAGVAWGALVWSFERFAPLGSRTRSRTSLASTLAYAVLALAVLGVIAVKAGSIAHRIHTQYDAFVHLGQQPVGTQSTRLFSGGGDRYDYWRVAVREFRSEPIHGVGAGNYPPGYYLHRRTFEEITQPHSLELQTLAELGLVGALLLLALLVAVGIGFARTARAAAGDRLARMTAVAAGGAFAGWLVETSVDWLHLIPGLTAIALAAAAALAVAPGTRRSLTRREHAVLASVALVVATVGVITIAPRVLSLHYQTAAERALARDEPRSAITDASRALDYDPNSVQALVLRAAGFARLHAFEPTLADLRSATTIEPHNWVTWALLGDLYTRRGDRRQARAAYRRAIALNPLEYELRNSLNAVGK